MRSLHFDSEGRSGSLAMSKIPLRGFTLRLSARRSCRRRRRPLWSHTVEPWSDVPATCRRRPELPVWPEPVCAEGQDREERDDDARGDSCRRIMSASSGVSARPPARCGVPQTSMRDCNCSQSRSRSGLSECGAASSHMRGRFVDAAVVRIETHRPNSRRDGIQRALQRTDRRSR